MEPIEPKELCPRSMKLNLTNLRLERGQICWVTLDRERFLNLAKSYFQDEYGDCAACFTFLHSLEVGQFIFSDLPCPHL